MAVRISFWAVIKAPVLRKRSTQNDKHSFTDEVTILWLPNGVSVRAQACSHPKDRFCDPDTTTLGECKFVRLLRHNLQKKDLRLANASCCTQC